MHVPRVQRHGERCRSECRCGGYGPVAGQADAHQPGPVLRQRLAGMLQPGPPTAAAAQLSSEQCYDGGRPAASVLGSHNMLNAPPLLPVFARNAGLTAGGQSQHVCGDGRRRRGKLRTRAHSKAERRGLVHGVMGCSWLAWLGFVLHPSFATKLDGTWQLRKPPARQPNRQAGYKPGSYECCSRSQQPWHPPYRPPHPPQSDQAFPWAHADLLGAM